MNFLTFFERLKHRLFRRPQPEPRPKISLLIPFRSDGSNRDIVFRWIMRYWQSELPDAEIVIGTSHSRVFSKTEAFNHAARVAHGDVFVLLDADAYMDGGVLDDCANQIIEDDGNGLWFVPYRRLYRLTKEITEEILESPPSDPLRLPSPPPVDDVEQREHSHYGHRYGAMVMIIPRVAYERLGCFDERFEGWGGEDVSILRALDTLYGKHKTTNNDLLHLWHPKIGSNYVERAWKGQKRQNPNGNLASSYHKASRNPSKMRMLVSEGCRYREEKRRRKMHVQRVVEQVRTRAENVRRRR